MKKSKKNKTSYNQLKEPKLIRAGNKSFKEILEIVKSVQEDLEKNTTLTELNQNVRLL